MGRCRDHPLAVDFEQQAAADMREAATVQQSINWPNGRFEIRHGLRRALLNPCLWYQATSCSVKNVAGQPGRRRSDSRDRATSLMVITFSSQSAVIIPSARLA